MRANSTHRTGLSLAISALCIFYQIANWNGSSPSPSLRPLHSRQSSRFTFSPTRLKSPFSFSSLRYIPSRLSPANLTFNARSRAGARFTTSTVSRILILLLTILVFSLDITTFILKTLSLRTNIRNTAFCPGGGGSVRVELPFVFGSPWDGFGPAAAAASKELGVGGSGGVGEKRSMLVSMALPIIFLWITDAFLVCLLSSYGIS